jgi:DNA-binding MarR family transcriptional regulator
MTDDFYNEMLKWFSTFARRALGDFHQFTRDAGLTMSQMNVLMRLYYQGPCDMTALLDTMLTTKGAVSQMVERMVQQGLVERAQAADDRRARLVTITPKGRKMVEDSISARRLWLEGIGDLLTNQQRADIAAALHTLAVAVTRADGKEMPVTDESAPIAHKKIKPTQ